MASREVFLSSAGGVVNRRLAEIVVIVLVSAWLVSVAAAVIDPSRADLAVSLAPIMGTVAGAAVAVLSVTKKRDNGGGK